jgi:hypothetical protein
MEPYGVAILMKVTSSLAYTWTVSYGSGAGTSPYSYMGGMCESTDNKIVAVGFSFEFGTSRVLTLTKVEPSGAYVREDVCVVKCCVLIDWRTSLCDTDGSVIWGKAYERDGITNSGRQIANSPDGGFIALGWTQPPTYTYGILIIKTDSMGALDWSKVYRSGLNNYNEEPRGVMPMLGGGYLVCGSGKSLNPSDSDGMLLKIDDNGEVRMYACVCLCMRRKG